MPLPQMRRYSRPAGRNFALNGREGLHVIQLSEAVGRFAEMLLWGMLRTAGVIGAWIAIGGVAAVLAFVAARRLVRRRRG